MARVIILGIVVIAWLTWFVKVFFDQNITKKSINWTRFIVRVAIFGAMAAILYAVPVLKFPVPIFPSFLEFHFDEIPAFIAGFAYGPFSAICVLLIKTVIKLPLSSTLCVGEITDFIFSAAFIIPATLFYKHRRRFSGAAIGIAIGTLCQVVISVILNIYAMVPFYMSVYGLNEEQLLAICQAANPAIKDIKWAYGLMAVLPFNLIKDSIVVLVTMLVYKSLHRLIDKIKA